MTLRLPASDPRVRQAIQGKPCRHNGTWLIAGGRYEWCYACGALRTTRETGIAECVVDSPWLRPVGVNAPNPWSKWAKARDSFQKRRANRARKAS